VIADGFPDVTVLFADLVDFTRRSQASSPQQLVQVLDELFSAFDQLARRHGLEKIKTIGDAYMVAGGLPEPRPDHAKAVADMALALREESARHRDPAGRPLALRIGIDTGPVVAGVIGQDKFSYDLWGDTSTPPAGWSPRGAGLHPGHRRTYQRLRDSYRFERRGLVAVKGRARWSPTSLSEELDDRRMVASAATTHQPGASRRRGSRDPRHSGSCCSAQPLPSGSLKYA
jgi:adenylate cyclase